MTRWKAAGIHLAISAVVIIALLGIVLSLWYPPELLHMSKVDALIAIIAVVDITAGPLLTLIVYKKGKPSLRMDLAVIGMIQAALLAYGVYTLAQVRPVFLVGVIDRFNLVAANEIDPRDLAQGKEPYNRLSWSGPQRVGAVLPLDAALRANIFERAVAGNDVHTLPRYYVPFDEVQEGLLARAPLVSEIFAQASSAEQAALLRVGGEDVRNLRYLPLQGARGTALMLLDPATGTPIAPVDLNPWATRTPKADQDGQ
ncbi:TfpX/TfpZ family type IV pilin accessory protein [Chiayiivirga flava]|uniref:Pilus assembly protein n=1 Tax=Chiayiivirga flava TaxID=659595 RepID=A0A7W8D6U3_9GAMM|nr:TfpX/TfpZ family type IV pilin accessory protein [Chiayiivirga flava]MBB5208978.1 hypothetical protein [Chiayiivirga flava]